MPNLEPPTNLDHLGKGIAFPCRLNVQGNIQLTAAGHNVDESIFIILKTKIGERIYRPDFGCRLQELVFAPMNSETLLMIRLCVEEAIAKWEPRAILDAVTVTPYNDKGRVDILIQYHPKNTHDRRSLVFPFYLNPQ